MKKIFLIAAMFAGLSVNAQQSKMRLRGDYKAAVDGKMLYLAKGYENIDSVEVKNGKFEFLLRNIEPDEYLIKRVTDDGKMEYIMVYLDNYDTHINVEKETYNLFNTNFIKNTSSGSPTQSTVTELNDIFMRTKGDPLDNEQFTSKLKTVAERGDMATAYLMWKYAQTFQRLLSVGQLRTYIDHLKPEVKATSVGKRSLDVYNTYFKSIAGGNAVDFTMTTPDGKSVRLYDFIKGKKLVLIDFWASWCAPCRAKNPQVLKLYNSFHGRGLDIIGVSLDVDSVKWKKAIADDKLPWTHVSDLKGWKSEVCKTYNFSGIPHMVLMNGDGKIIASGNDIIKQMDYYMADLSK